MKKAAQKHHKIKKFKYFILVPLLFLNICPLVGFGQQEFLAHKPLTSTNTVIRNPKPIVIPKKAKTSNRPLWTTLSSGNLPEKYFRKILFEIPTAELFKKYGWGDFSTCKVDGDENVYLNFRTAIVELDKLGKLVKVIKKLSPIESTWFLVDETGNIFLKENSVEKNHIVSAVRIFDSNGNLVDQPDIRKWQNFEKGKVKFSNGVLFSKLNLNIFYSIPGSEKLIKTHNLTPKIERDEHFPGRGTIVEGKRRKCKIPNALDGFSFDGVIIEIDDLGNIYARYSKDENDGSWPRRQTYRVYKFGPECQLLTLFDFIPDDINLEKGTVYHLESISNAIRMTKWIK